MLKNFTDFINEEAAKDVGNLTGIIDTKIDWYGEDPSNKSKFYEDFKKPIYSVRATFLNLRAYAVKHNITDIKGIVARWCLGKTPSTLDEKDKQTYHDYLTALNKYTGLNEDVVIKYENGNLVMKVENIVNLFKLVQGIIQEESGHLDEDDLGEYKTVQQIVVAAFELETKDSNSPPAYKKFNVDLANEEYKTAREEYLNGQKVAKAEGEKKPNGKDAFKKILKDFK